MAKNVLPPATSEQLRAWGYYGLPNTPKGVSSSAPRIGAIGSQVGEVRYVIGWMADQMVRMGWRVAIKGSESWSIDLPNDGGKVVSDAEESDLDSPKHPTNASRVLLAAIEWDSRTVREVTTNLFVAGELHYCLDGDDWRVVSVIRPDRDEIAKRSPFTVRGIWPHPANPDAPDAPLFGVLGTLDDMAWLNRLSRSQSANRVGMRGIIGYADSFTNQNGETGDAFWQSFEDSLSRPMDSPEDVSPVGIRGPAELVEPKDGGMKGLSWTIPNFPYDDRIDERMDRLVQRLAYGLPIPPEILLGLQAQSKATAFQVEGATYRAHIEPVAFLVSRVATDAMKMILETAGEIEVIPDPTAILARRHSVSDVIEAFDRGAAGYDYLREVLGIPSRAAFTEDDIALHQRISGKDRAEVKDPGNEAASEPLSAAVSLPQEAPEGFAEALSPDDEWLGEQLVKIDLAILHELIGASHQGVVKARERLGAKVRTDKRLREQCPKDMPNEEVALKIGRDALETLGVNVDGVISDALASTLSWWQARALKAQEVVVDLLETGGVPVELDAGRVDRSRDALHELLTALVFDSRPPAEVAFRKVVGMAGE